MKNCPLCGSKNFEVMEDESFICKKCGLGVKGDPNFDNHLHNVWVIAVFTKQFYPNLSRKKLADKICEILHKIEHHPTRPDGYCEFCEKLIT